MCRLWCRKFFYLCYPVFFHHFKLGVDRILVNLVPNAVFQIVVQLRWLKAQTQDGKNKKTTDTFTVLYKPEKPKLEISEPSDRSTVNNPEVTVKGKTDKEVYIRVNGLPVVVNAQGDFDATVRLKEGENTIAVDAEDVAGNFETKTLVVTYQKED